jgi:iron-sulfur cluster repair protein YtfE (RIC family)
MNKPIKRHQALQPLSRDHHQGLLLCWKIRAGLRKGVELKRIKTYCDWFFSQHLQPHFEAEEKYIFPILGADHDLIKRALSEHSKLLELLDDPGETENSFIRIADELEKHIRFEERILFNEIQQVATAEQLALFNEHHTEEKFCENEKDAFWN